MLFRSPKSLLRHPQAVSKVEELTKGTFHEVIGDSAMEIAKAKKCILVSGKLYYELVDAREKNKITDTAIIRIEQLYPFPETQLKAVFKGAKKLESVIWAQEEPKNMGAWSYICHPLREFTENLELPEPQYVGRTHRASPATGTTKKHQQEQQQILKDCFKN